VTQGFVQSPRGRWHLKAGSWEAQGRADPSSCDVPLVTREP